ncbi:hypothetical protein [Prevotella pallens]|uniref:hypothetical protein n=1 Tax=Prevotella pallens TaxID=60133 RepID=UPI0023F2C06A|nr:hypothetical protein [Prevotella pallens]
MIAFIQFGVDGRDESAPTPTDCTLRIVHVYPRAPTVIRDCIYIIRVNGRDESAPTPTECMLRIVHVHPLRGRFIVPAYHGMYGVDILCFICFVFHCAIVYLCALMIFFFRSVAPTHVATTLN